MASEREETPVLPRWDRGLHAYLVARAERDGSDERALSAEHDVPSAEEANLEETL
jgi:hypothetical protein